MTTTYWGPFTQPPNLLILMTDQQRTAQYLPAGWVQQNLPNLWSLQQGGVSFPNAMTNTTACSPSRATLWTSTFPMLNGVDSVGATLDLATHSNLTTLGLALANYAPAGVSYNIAYKGKWHLDSSFETGMSEQQQQMPPQLAKQSSDNQTMAATYGFPAWTSQDFGTQMVMDLSAWKGSTECFSATVVNTLAAGGGGNDVRVTTGLSYVTGGTVEGAQAWLAAQAGNAANNPFCLVVSLLNPHDIFVSPAGYVSAGYASAGSSGPYPWQVAPFTEITELPASYALSAAELANKPTIQGNFRWTAAQGATQASEREAAALDYLRFYAYLETLSDALLGQVLSALTPTMASNTLIVRLADHGEMGMSQGGMVEKEHQSYNETLLVPLVFSNPGLPQAATCPGLAGLIDVLPTLAEICGLSIPSELLVQGQSLAPAILAGANGSTSNTLLFASDDSNAQIRALIEDQSYNAKYVVSSNGSDGWQCELYDFSYDSNNSAPWPSEITNLIPVNGLQDGSSASSPAIQATWSAMHQALTAAMISTQTTPANWPAAPPA